MTITEAKNIGSRQGMISVGLGFLAAQLIMTLLLTPDEGFLSAFTWLLEINYIINIIIGAVVMLLSGHYFGQLAGKEIIMENRDQTWVGFKYGMLILWTGTFMGSLIGFFGEVLCDNKLHSAPFFDYLFKPMFWVTIFGMFPVLIVGFWFGRQIKKKVK